MSGPGVEREHGHLFVANNYILKCHMSLWETISFRREFEGNGTNYDAEKVQNGLKLQRIVKREARTCWC